MMRRPRRTHRLAFTTQMALAAIREEQTLTELAQPFDVHPNPIKPWQEHRLAGVPAIFDSEGKPVATSTGDVPALHAKIGALTWENGC